MISFEEVSKTYSNQKSYAVRDLSFEVKSGDIDLYAEYTCTGLVTILKEKVMHDSQKTYHVVKEKFAQKYDLPWFTPFGFNNTYNLTMRREQAEQLKIRTISDLVALVGHNSQENHDET